MRGGNSVPPSWLVTGNTVVAQVQTRRHPDKWKTRFLTKLTWGIIVLNVAFNMVVFINYALMMSEDP